MQILSMQIFQTQNVYKKVRRIITKYLLQTSYTVDICVKHFT